MTEELISPIKDARDIGFVLLPYILVFLSGFAVGYMLKGVFI